MIGRSRWENTSAIRSMHKVPARIQVLSSAPKVGINVGNVLLELSSCAGLVAGAQVNIFGDKQDIGIVAVAESRFQKLDLQSESVDRHSSSPTLWLEMRVLTIWRVWLGCFVSTLCLSSSMPRGCEFGRF